ncbi:MAG: nucleotide exchange factor GrpE [Kiritimatiellia bacterium]
MKHSNRPPKSPASKVAISTPSAKTVRHKPAAAAETGAAETAAETGATPPVGEESVPVEADERVKQLEDDLARLKDAHLRLMADFENHRRRNAREREELVKRATENLMESLLPTLDAIDLAMKQKPEGNDPFAQGIVMVFDLLRKGLEAGGLKAIEDATGQPFDPQFHDAVATSPSPDVPENAVIEQTRRGYLLNGWLLRAAQVVVSSGATEEDAPDADADDAPDASEG